MSTKRMNRKSANRRFPVDVTHSRRKTGARIGVFCLRAQGASRDDRPDCVEGHQTMKAQCGENFAEKWKARSAFFLLYFGYRTFLLVPQKSIDHNSILFPLFLPSLVLLSIWRKFDSIWPPCLSSDCAKQPPFLLFTSACKSWHLLLMDLSVH